MFYVCESYGICVEWGGLGLQEDVLDNMSKHVLFPTDVLHNHARYMPKNQKSFMKKHGMILKRM